MHTAHHHETLTLPNILHLHTDVAVIGAGTAGLAAYRAARREGARALLIEGGPYGTTCARVGCMPSKLLIAAAEGVHAMERLEAFGIDAPAAAVDGQRVMARVRSERDRFVGFVLEGVEAIPTADKVRGWARFLDAHTLEVDLEVDLDHATEQGAQKAHIHFKSVVLATGSSPNKPKELLAAGDKLVVNDDIFNWTDLPQSVFVVGAGVIALELGQALSRLGVEVTLVGRKGNLGGISDPGVREAAQAVFASEFNYIRDGAVLNVERIAASDRHEMSASPCTIKVRYHDSQAHANTEQTKTVDYVISAAGRRPNLDRLELERTGLRLADNAVPAFDAHTMQLTETPALGHFFIAGDVNADVPLLHEAADEGAIAGANAARVAQGLGVKAGKRRTPLSIVFSDPNIVSVGQAYRDLDQAQTAVGQVSFQGQGRARVMLLNQGLLRVYGDLATRRFLGAEMIGPRTEHIAHLLAWAHQMQLTVDQMLAMPFYHPVIEEGLRTALRDLAAQLDAA